MKRNETFQMFPKEIPHLKYEAISVPQGSVRLDKKTQLRKKFSLLFVDHQRCHEFESIITKDHPCRGEMHVKYVESSNVLSMEWCVRTAQASSSSLDHGSKLRGPSPKALV
ncbi:hypothetical protein TNCV_2291691 [Trichonephila clavipes]|uniref:Uncharacterized protein n=1 Tax=Trichonephila clavipes TaxID=2585209 RepID=A0A8X6RJ75_TRICX|nr:hypothetical protein TNCV_2291691 [Trichonephila clavipes]